MSTQITIDLPEGAFSALRQSKAEFAAELAGLSRADFISALERFRVSPFQVEPGELARELGPS